MSVSVIIPALNEQDWIAGAVESAFASGAAEVIVADAGSDDRTTRHATAAGARVLLTDRLRAKQSNLGAETSSHEVLIFLHADTRLPAGAADAAAHALEDADFGGFRIRFLEPSRELAFAAAAINLRTRLTRCPWGDQAQFIRRETFLEIGGFKEMPLMEDYELAIRMKRRGLTTILPMTVTTSGRRFLRKGLVRTAARNWRTVIAYRMGADIDELARSYRR
ncbi:MAG: TIGR04283 family arsenosugar biosynthesis glycosyltransferase [Acidobacteria bacterium]|nr:TIGR04283 family arsenosugar biosynthesis glycosyltransferase [Acidobacteriota bacterium]MBV9187284.1 TIGR04283 family arsenosugar biosynthesis glycosyltransferase [Acidobacteriota bacterium]